MKGRLGASLVWCDAHLDLAHLEKCGRDLTAPLDVAGGPQPAAVTLLSLADGNVLWAFATVFTGAGYEGVGGYPHGDAEAARKLGIEQLETYQRLEDEGRLLIVRRAEDLDDRDAPLRVVLLMEGGDPIRDPDDTRWWFQCGVRIVGLTWMNGSRYAGGNKTGGELSDAGRELVAALDDLGVVHDLSHLADESAWQLLDLARGPVIASHSNVRQLIDPANERHLSDELIDEIGRREGVVGLNLLFGVDLHLRTADSLEGDHGRPSLEALVDHAERIAELMGRRDGVGLGSDMDGGLGADWLPQGIDKPADLRKLATELLGRGWTGPEVEGLASANWLNFVRRALP